MNELLLRLLEALERIGEDHDEIGDTVCRDAMRSALHDGFLLPAKDFRRPSDFGLTTEEGNQRVRDALFEFIQEANKVAADLGFSFRDRLMALQNASVHTDDGTTSDEFFGYTPPSAWTEQGEWLLRDDSQS